MSLQASSLKRFYKKAAVRAEDGRFSVWLDDSAVKTPAGNHLVLPTQALAEVIVAEWQAQGAVAVARSAEQSRQKENTRIRHDTMPLLQMAMTVTDFFPQQRHQTIAWLVNAAATDTLCHRELAPSPLRIRQEALWQPHLDGLEASTGIRMDVTDQLSASILPQEAKARLEAVLNGLDDWTLQGVDIAVSATGSLVLALRLKERATSAEKAFAAAELERHFQMEKWGSDEELKARLDGVRKDLEAVQRWFKLLG